MKFLNQETANREYWQRHYRGMENYLGLPAHDQIADFLVNVYDLVGKNVLELGGGPGIHSKLLQDKAGARCVNLDASSYALSFLSHEVQSVQQELTETPWEILDFKEYDFDFCFSIQTMEHIPASGIPGVFAELRRWLKPDAGVFVSVAKPGNDADDTHCTLRGKDWWYLMALNHGYEHDHQREKVFDRHQLIGQLKWNCLFLRTS